MSIINSLFANRNFAFHEIKDKAFAELFHKINIIHAPFITVSREPGSGGKLIARRLSEHLNFKFYYKEIIDRMSKNRETANEYLEHYDEKELGFIDDFTTSIIHPYLISRDHFVKELIKYTSHLALRGRCVILGRGANFFTDHRFGFHVRITAPFEYRVEKTMKYEKLSRPKASERVREVSRARKHFVEKYFSTHIDNSEYYDLVLNRAYYSIEDTVAIIIHAFKKKMK
jgi:cytidylate kinase